MILQYCKKDHIIIILKKSKKGFVMNNNAKERVIIIGNYMAPLKKKLRLKGVIIENIIQGCNPLAMCGRKNIGDEIYCSSINDTANTLNIRKNLDAMLSRDPDIFCDNTLFVELGDEKRYANSSDYIIICNSMLAYKIYTLRNIVYSDIWPRNDFITSVINDPESTGMTIPYDTSFNWKHYYSEFVDTITRYYDKDHIILLKTNVSHWYMDGENIEQIGNNSLEIKNFIKAADDLFEEKTHCITVDEMFNFIPVKKFGGALPNSQMSDSFYTGLADTIFNIINGKYKSDLQKRKKNFNYLAQKISGMLNSRTAERLASLIEYIEENWIMKISDIECEQAGIDEKTKDSLIRLSCIIENKDINDFSDYYIYNSVNSSFIDSEVISDYCRMCRCTLSDMITFYKLGNDLNSEDISEICSSEEDGIIYTTLSFVRNNMQIIKNYSNASEGIRYIMDTFDISAYTPYIKVESGLFLVLDRNEEKNLIKTELIEDSKNFDIDTVLDTMSCCIDSANTLIRSMPFYIRRAKEEKARTPVTINFRSEQELIRSLFYIDYADMLSNENFILKLDNEEMPVVDYLPRTDLSFIYGENTKIIYMTAGLSDQICYYLFSKKLQEKTNAEIYYDDLTYYTKILFNGLEVDKFCKEDISSRLITNILSPALLSGVKDENFADFLHRNGLCTIGAIAADAVRYDIIKRCPRMFFPVWPVVDLTSIFDNSFNFKPSYYSILIRPEWLADNKGTDVREYLEIKPFDDENNLKYQKLMTECDSVVIHIRRGDFVSLGWDTDFDYYKESLEKLKAIEDYPNKKFFVFSDDIPWCRDHINDTGMNDYFPNAEVYYIDHNKYESSYKDMLLMTYAKIIIGSNSGFVRMAAYLSQSCEIFMCYNLQVVKVFEEKVRKNKYDVGVYKKKYSTDYSSKAPKK